MTVVDTVLQVGVGLVGLGAATVVAVAAGFGFVIGVSCGLYLVASVLERRGR